MMKVSHLMNNINTEILRLKNIESENGWTVQREAILK